MHVFLAEYIRLMCMPLGYCCQYHGQYCSEMAEFTDREDSILGLQAYDFFLFFQFHNFFFFYSSFLSFFSSAVIIWVLHLEGEKRSSD